MADLSLAEELGNAIDEAGNEDAHVGTVENAAPVEKAEITKEAAAPVAKTETAEKTEKPAITEAKSETPETPTDIKALVTPPATWSASAKAIYSTLPETARKEIAKREQDYARGIQQHAEHAKGYQNMMREFQPYEAMIRAENGTPEGAIRDLLKTSYLLRTGSPQERGNLVMQIAQRFGADLTPHMGQKQEAPGQTEFMPQVEQYVQQLVSPHLQRIQSWEQSQAIALQQQQQELQQNTMSQIEAFQSATAEDGSPKHVYFENVRALMSGYFANGQAESLDQAYEMACWANPEVRAAMQADMQRSAESQRLEEAKRKTKDAKGASFNVTGQGGTGIAGTTQPSLRDELSSQLESAMGGGRL